MYVCNMCTQNKAKMFELQLWQKKHARQKYKTWFHANAKDTENHNKKYYIENFTIKKRKKRNINSSSSGSNRVQLPNDSAGKQINMFFVVVECAFVHSWIYMHCSLLQGQNRTGYISCMLTFLHIYVGRFDWPVYLISVQTTQKNRLKCWHNNDALHFVFSSLSSSSSSSSTQETNK